MLLKRAVRSAESRLKQSSQLSKGSDAVFTPKQAPQQIARAHTYPTRLTATVWHLGLEDSLVVYNAASPTEPERRTLRNVINQKIGWFKSSAQGRKSTRQIAGMNQRLRCFLADRPYLRWRLFTSEPGV